MAERIITPAAETAFATRLTTALNTTEGIERYYEVNDYEGLVKIINRAIDASPQNLDFWGDDEESRKTVITKYIEKFFPNITLPELETSEVETVAHRDHE